MKNTTLRPSSQSIAADGLSEEQHDVVSALVHGIYRRRARQTLGGYAGTGKTTLIRVLKGYLPNFVVCAFTGKAANVLRRKGLVDAGTIHSAIYIPVRGADGRTYFTLRDHMPVEVDGFIVDESSMVSESIYRDLTSFGLPIIFVGDHGQLEPVGRNANLMIRPDYTLETIHRNSGEIPRFAEHLRFGRPAKDFRSTSGAVTLITSEEIDDDTALSADQIICAFNRTRVTFNTHIRKVTGRKGVVEVGERVMCLKNDRDLGIFNGMQGIVSKVETIDDNLHIDFDPGAPERTRPALMVDRHQFGQEKGADIDSPRLGHPFDYAYAITAHKAQGDEWSTVLVFEQKCKHWDHRRWAYTAASRAQHKLLWVTTEKGRGA